MIELLTKLFRLLTPVQRRRFYRLQFLIIIMSFAETLGIVSIIPFMSLVGDMSQLQADNTISDLYKLSGIASPTEFVFSLGFAVLLLLFISSLICMYTTWRLSMFASEIGSQISARLYNYYINQDWLFHASGSIAKLTKKIANESMRVSTGIIYPLLVLSSRIFFTSVLVIGIFIYDPVVGIIGATLYSLAYFILFKFVRGRLHKNGESVSIENEKRFSLINEAFGGIKDILLLGRQRIFSNRFNAMSQKLAYSQGANQAYAQAPKFFVELVAFSSMIVLLLYLLARHDGSLGVILPIISVYALATLKLLPAFQQIYVSIAGIKSNVSAFKSIEIDLFHSLKMEVNPAKEKIDSLKLKKQISCKDIFFTYPGKTEPSLRMINLSIQANSTVGIVGSSGSGKSTLTNILLGLVEPQKGQIMVDDIILNKNNRRSWQNTIGFVAQNIFLLQGTIAENIAMGIPKNQIDFEQVHKTIRLTHLSDMVDSLKLGLNTEVGERGVKLSGGQRQRIAIARALYHRTDILVFDEATSSLDGVTENIILDAINEMSGKKTIIMIAHRLKTLKRCDQIFFMDKGEVVGKGTYQELLEKNSNFKNLADHT